MGKIDVLVVDDQKRVGETVASWLELSDSSFDLTVRTDPSYVMENSEKIAERMDAVISDYEMPYHDGLEVIEELTDQKSRLVTAIYSGRNLESIKEDLGKEEIGHKYFQKGVDISTFEEIRDYVLKEVQKA